MRGSSNIAASLQRMQSYRSNLEARGPVGLIDSDKALRPLRAAIVAIEQRVENLARPRSSSTSIAASRVEWADVRPEVTTLSKRAVRILCADPETVSDGTFIMALKANGMLTGARRLGERLLDAYDTGWTAERAVVLAPFIRLAFEGASRMSRKAQRFLSEPQLLSPKAPTFIAKHAVEAMAAPRALGEQFYLAGNGNLEHQARSEMFPVWQSQLKTRRSASERFDLRRFGFEHFVAESTVPPVDRANATSFLIENTNEQSAQEMEWLRDRVLALPILGDPRRPSNRNNWSLVEHGARRKFTKWLAKEDIRFFFEEVMKNAYDPHGRRAYWDRWLDDTRLVDSCVALSASDRSYLAARGVLKKGMAFSSLAGGADGVSAFLLRFRSSTSEILAIEFSKVGNAAYFHDGERFDRLVGGMHRVSYDIVRHLKNHASKVSPPGHLGSHWTSHTENWQYRFDEGIRELLR